MTCISKDSGKCVDTYVMSRFCKRCEQWKAKKDTPKYEQWRKNHKCMINHTGSAASMESAGAKKIFQRSVPFLNLRFTSYISETQNHSKMLLTLHHTGI